MDEQRNSELPIACDLSALDATIRASHLAAAHQLLSNDAAEVRELPDGYAFRYAAEQYVQVTQFIANERLCCPFFTFVLEVTPARGPLWLRVTGGAGVKDFIACEFGACDCA